MAVNKFENIFRAENFLLSFEICLLEHIFPKPMSLSSLHAILTLELRIRCI